MGFVDWKLETLSIAAALGALMAILGTLLPHAGQPLPQWHYGISINTLLSIYAVIFKTALLFVLSNCILQLQWAGFATPRPLRDLLSYDQASRGAWGSWLWLYQHRLRAPIMSLATILTIMSLAIDPFTQQLVIPTDCQTLLQDSNATLPRTNSLMDYSDKTGDFFFGRLATWITTASSNSALQSSLVCGSGNCTFPEYTTLGYCSECIDVSDTMTFTATDLNATQPKFITTVRWPGQALPDADSELVWGETMRLNSTTSKLDTNMTFLNGGLSSHWTRRADGGWDDSISDVDVQIFMPGNWFTATGRDPNDGKNLTGCDGSGSPPTWRCRGYGAASCSVHKCARAYTAKVDNGHLTETLVASSAGVYWGGNPGANPDTQGSGLLDQACLKPGQRDELNRKGRLESNINARFIRYSPEGWSVNGTSQPPSALVPLDAELVADGCLFLAFQMIDSADFTLAKGLAPALATSPVEAVGWFTYRKMAANPEPDHLFDIESMYATSYHGSSLLLSLWNGGNISFWNVQAAMANLSDLMTTYVRLHGDPGNASAPARGEVSHYAICLEVSWPWIALPAALWVGTVVLLGVVAGAASAKRHPVWKDSDFLLGWIYRGPQTLDAGPDASVKGMETQAARHIIVFDGGLCDQNPRLRAVATVPMLENGGVSRDSLCEEEEDDDSGVIPTGRY